MKTAAVILNYNDASGTVDAVKRISGFFCLDGIVIVDNASTDNSAEVIKSALDVLPEKVRFIQAERNGGYGYGNQLGIEYAVKQLGAKLVVVANPDASFSENIIEKMAEAFQKDPLTAVVGAVMHNGTDRKVSYREYILSGWKQRNLPGHVLNGGPICSRILRKQLNYPLTHYRKGKEKLVEVYAVHGSLLMMDADKFLECGGYDDNIFLYCEENVLAEKFRKAGYRSYLLRDVYQHVGSQSITGSGLGAVRRQKLRNISENYFYRQYLGAGRITMMLIRLFQSVVMLETIILEKIS